MMMIVWEESFPKDQIHVLKIIIRQQLKSRLCLEANLIWVRGYSLVIVVCLKAMHDKDSATLLDRCQVGSNSISSNK